MKLTNQITHKKVQSVGMITALVVSGLFSQTMAIKKRPEKIKFTDGPTKSSEIKKYFQFYFTNHLPNHNAPGAVFTMIKNGRILLSNGYGSSDYKKGIKFDDKKSILTVGSLSKLFTVIGILQLYENGKIDLDAPIQSYLKSVALPSEEPITIRDLLFHREGFEVQVIGGSAKHADNLISNKDEMNNYPPRPIIKPGQSLTYGNDAINILGAVIADISQMQYSQYIQENIFNRLSMEHSTFEQILPTSWLKNIAKGYHTDSGKFIEDPYIYMNFIASGGLRTTGNDMAKLMSAIVPGATRSSKQNKLLNKDTLSLLYSQVYQPHPKIPGVSFGFMQKKINDRMVYINDGDSLGFRTRLFVIPKENIAVFVHFNTSQANRLREKFLADFMDHYFHKSPQKITEKTQIVESGFEKYTGIYRPIQADESSFFKVTLLYAQYIEVNSSESGLTTSGAPMGDALGGFNGVNDWVQEKNGVFRKTLYKNFTDDVFTFNEINGKVNYLYSGQAYHGVYRKLSFFERPDVHKFLLALAMIVFHLTIFFWPLAGVWFKKIDPDYTPLSLLNRAALTSVIIIYPALLVWLVVELRNVVDVIFGVPLTIKLLLTGYTFAFILTLGVAYLCVQLWRKKEGSVYDRIVYTVVTVTALLYNAGLYHWNLIGWNY